MKWNLWRSLSFWTFLALIAGAAGGHVLTDISWQPEFPLERHASFGWLEIFDILGNVVFLGLLKMLVVPLIVVSVIGGVAQTASLSTLRFVGVSAVVYYLITMLIAATIGVVVVVVMKPGQALSLDSASFIETQQVHGSTMVESVVTARSQNTSSSFRQFVELFLTDNIFDALQSGRVLPLILFSLFFGIIVALGGQHTQIIRDFVEALFKTLVGMVRVVLWLTPLGVFCLVAHAVARVGIASLGGALGVYAASVVLGLLVHATVILPLLLWLFSRENPFSFLKSMRQALLTACGTCSSSATLPVSLDCCGRHGAMKEEVSRLILPLGATINMDGTALYEAVAVVFLAQAFGITLGPGELCLIIGTATLAAMGAASIPSAGLVTMVIVIEAVNSSLLATNPQALLIPVESVAIILAVDRPLDMLRTTVNVWGDVVGARIISSLKRTA